MSLCKLGAFIVLLLTISNLDSQLSLNANGIGNTYELIDSLLAGGSEAHETPDCGHTSFGRHISEVWDADLSKFVFQFNMHLNEDDDRCLSSTKQRNEIKTFASSADSLKGLEGEIVRYSWKFKLDSNFQPSYSFTHLHQIKVVGGSEESIPLITITPRKASTNKMQLLYADSMTQYEVAFTDLDLFLGKWIYVDEYIEYGEQGKYRISLKEDASGIELISYCSDSIRMWKTAADFSRPKWGIYRSLSGSAPSHLRDENVLFSDFIIEELDEFYEIKQTYDSLCYGGDFVFGTNTYSQSGTYYDTLSNSQGCDSIVELNLHVKQEQLVSVNASQDTVFIGDSVQFSFNGQGNAIWFLGSGDTLSSNTITHSFNQPGNYNVVVEVEYLGCSYKDSITIYVYQPTTTIEESTKEYYTVYPNPASDEIVIEMLDLSRVRIFNSNGLMMSDISSKNNMMKVDVSTLTKGIYMVLLDSKLGQKQYKLVISR